MSVILVSECPSVPPVTDLVPTLLGGRAWRTEAFALRGREKKPKRRGGRERGQVPRVAAEYGLIRGPGQGACEDGAALPHTGASLRENWQSQRQQSPASAPAGLAIAAPAGFRPAPSPPDSSAGGLTCALTHGALSLSKGQPQRWCTPRGGNWKCV